MKTYLLTLTIVAFAFLALNATATTYYVDVNSTNPVPPYSSWGTAATNIQAAVDAANPGDVVLVTNGVYATGGRTAPDGSPTSIVVTNAVSLQSVNGATVTLIDGNQAMRCVYLADGAVLTGFTLTNGASVQQGGGIYCHSETASVSNCVVIGNSTSPYIAGTVGGGVYQGTLADCILSGNSAQSGAGACAATLNHCVLIGNSTSYQGQGGGACYGTLNNCTVSGNSAEYGGGAFYATLSNCTLGTNSGSLAGGGSYSSTLGNCILIGNTAPYGGGVYLGTLNNCDIISNSATSGGGEEDGTLNNCIVYYNSGGNSASDYQSVNLNYCCTTPLPTNSVGDITNEPLFVDLAAGDFHLQSNSPCINSGNNAYVTVTNDLDGNPRIVGGTVDIGAYEYQTPVSKISYAWLQQYGLSITTNIDTTDLDGTGFDVYQDWIAGLNPTNALSVLAMLPPAPTNNPAGLVVSWESVSNRTYFLQSSTNLGMQPAFSTVQSNITGQTSTTTYLDTTATNDGPYFYRVGVQQ